MDTDVVTLFFALLATLAQLVVVAAVLLWLGSLVSPSVARAKASALAVIGPQALSLAAVVALVCTLGSLYLSEVADFIPCKLCWYQRIAMYPQVLLLAIAWFRRDEGIRSYSLPLAVVGACISTFHILVERFPSLEGSGGVCDPSNPCTIRWVEEFGFITIPTMALSEIGRAHV